MKKSTKAILTVLYELVIIMLTKALAPVTMITNSTLTVNQMDNTYGSYIGLTSWLNLSPLLGSIIFVFFFMVVPLLAWKSEIKSLFIDPKE